MNKIRVIDLLNKIANGEEVPKKIEFKGTIYLWYERIENTFNYREIYNGRLVDSYLNDNWFIDSKSILNDEIEIIEDTSKISKLYINNKLQYNLEEEKKIPEKLPYYSMEKIQKAKNKDEWLDERITLLEKRVDDLHIKMNDLLDYLKSKGE